MIETPYETISDSGYENINSVVVSILKSSGELPFKMGLSVQVSYPDKPTAIHWDFETPEMERIAEPVLLSAYGTINKGT